MSEGENSGGVLERRPSDNPSQHATQTKPEEGEVSNNIIPTQPNVAQNIPEMINPILGENPTGGRASGVASEITIENDPEKSYRKFLKFILPEFQFPLTTDKEVDDFAHKFYLWATGVAFDTMEYAGEGSNFVPALNGASPLDGPKGFLDLSKVSFASEPDNSNTRTLAKVLYNLNLATEDSGLKQKLNLLQEKIVKLLDTYFQLHNLALVLSKAGNTPDYGDVVTNLGQAAKDKNPLITLNLSSLLEGETTFSTMAREFSRFFLIAIASEYQIKRLKKSSQDLTVLGYSIDQIREAKWLCGYRSANTDNITKNIEELLSRAEKKYPDQPQSHYIAAFRVGHNMFLSAYGNETLDILKGEFLAKNQGLPRIWPYFVRKKNNPTEPEIAPNGPFVLLNIWLFLFVKTTRLSIFDSILYKKPIQNCDVEITATYGPLNNMVEALNHLNTYWRPFWSPLTNKAWKTLIPPVFHLLPPRAEHQGIQKLLHIAINNPPELAKIIKTPSKPITLLSLINGGPLKRWRDLFGPNIFLADLDSAVLRFWKTNFITQLNTITYYGCRTFAERIIPEDQLKVSRDSEIPNTFNTLYSLIYEYTFSLGNFETPINNNQDSPEAMQVRQVIQNNRQQFMTFVKSQLIERSNTCSSVDEANERVSLVLKNFKHFLLIGVLFPTILGQFTPSRTTRQFVNDVQNLLTNEEQMFKRIGNTIQTELSDISNDTLTTKLGVSVSPHQIELITTAFQEFVETYMTGSEGKYYSGEWMSRIEYGDRTPKITYFYEVVSRIFPLSPGLDTHGGPALYIRGTSNRSIPLDQVPQIIPYIIAQLAALQRASTSANKS